MNNEDYERGRQSASLESLEKKVDSIDQRLETLEDWINQQKGGMKWVAMILGGCMGLGAFIYYLIQSVFLFKAH